ncbi:hypothetical protein V1512DRAFT_165837 [Lipomyces arxii]|uniref:uncharacterized protein n=1 Tax=Lipomyces arxii TaxID=56418 RepID=UPI0034CFAF75
MTSTDLDNALLLQSVDSYDDRQIGLREPIPAFYNQLCSFVSEPTLAAKILRIGVIVELFEMPGLDGRMAEMVKQASEAFKSLHVGTRVEYLSQCMQSRLQFGQFVARQIFSEHGLCGPNVLRFSVHDASLKVALSK